MRDDDKKNDTKLWCDLKTDEEKIGFVRSGRAWCTGIIAKSFEMELIELLEFRIKYKEMKKGKIEKNFNEKILAEVKLQNKLMNKILEAFKEI